MHSVIHIFLTSLIPSRPSSEVEVVKGLRMAGRFACDF